MNDDKKGGKKRRAKKQPTGNYPNGYAKPPESGKIKKGEVRNPHGRNGKPKPEIDAFFEAMEQETTVIINGETLTVPAEQAMYLRHVALAISGNVATFKTLVGEKRARRGNQPPALTAAEIQLAEAEEAQRQELSAKIVGLLQAAASAKKAGAPRTVIRNVKAIKLQPGEPDPD